MLLLPFLKKRGLSLNGPLQGKVFPGQWNLKWRCAMAPVVIRLADRNDAVFMKQIHENALASCSAFYSKEVMQILTDPSRLTAEGYMKAIQQKEIYVALLNHKMAGFVHFDSREIHGLFVDPGHQKKGIGKKLVRKFFEENKNRSNFVVESTLNAEAFYQKMGFKTMKKTYTVRSGIKIPVIKMGMVKS